MSEKRGKSWKRDRKVEKRRGGGSNDNDNKSSSSSTTSTIIVDESPSKDDASEVVNTTAEVVAAEAEVEVEEEKESEEAQRQKEEEEKMNQELATLKEYAEEAKRRLSWKAKLRKLNQNPEEDRPEESDFHKLDSSLKKNTAFIRKLKNYTDSQKDSVMKDLQSLNLTKYIEEVATALVEAKLKMTDLQGVVELCSVLHRRYADFVQHFMEAWTKVLNLKRDAVVSNPSKLRVDLRLYADLVSVGVFSLKEGLPLLGSVLTALVALDKESHSNISIILTFCKHCGDDYAGLLPKKIRILSETYGYQIPRSTLLPPDKQKNVRQMLRDYFNSVCKHLLTDHSELQSLERTNRRILMTKGEVHTERLEKATNAATAYAKLLSNAEMLADVLDEDLPEILDKSEKEDEDNLDEENADESMKASNLSGGLWEDEDTKNFYEDLADLKAFIPAILYKDSSTQPKIEIVETEEAPLGEEDEVEETVECDGEEEEGIVEDEDVVPPPIEVEEEPEEETPQNTSNKMLLDAYFAQLPTCVNREMIDNAAADFCMNLNTKKNRSKLVKALFNVHRNRQDLLPFYARLVATLYPCMPEIAVDLGQYLKQEFRWQLRKKDQMKIESKLKVCRFIGELVKFKMFPKGEALFCMKQLLYDFSHHHIEMACTLMETAGRYLYRSPESHQRTKIYLEQMMRKKTAMMSADSRYNMMIENAYYNVCPPEVSLAEQRAAAQLPPKRLYVQKLLFGDLCKNNTEKILRQIRKLDWESLEESDFAISSLCQVWKVKYFNIRYVASLLAGLISYHDWVGPRIVDNILEDIRLGMEINDPKYNQRRISVIKFLGELYNYRLVDSGVIFKVLYSLITFGHQFDDGISPLDPPDHMLRIRLVCGLLDTCGIYFNAGSNKKRLDYFFVYFQRYIWMKRASPFWTSGGGLKFPFAIDNLINETLPSLRPKIIMLKSLEEAQEKVAEIEKEVLASIRAQVPDFGKVLPPQESSSNFGLESIAEVNEEQQQPQQPQPQPQQQEEQEEFDYDEENQSRSRSMSQAYENSQEDDSQMQDLSESEDAEEEEEEEEEDEDEDEEDEDEDMEHRRGREIEEGAEDLLVPSFPKMTSCPEDLEFVNMFDRMMNENITETRSGARARDISVPMHLKQNKNRTFDQLGNNDNGEGPPANTVRFSVLMRKGGPGTGNNKQVYRELAVPADSDLAKNLLRQEEAARREKERVKQLTLEINERQEEEDLNEALASMQRPALVNSNRESRRGRFQPPKGAPDADLIFGSKRGPPNLGGGGNGGNGSYN